jgi:hypothetical protein
MPSLAIKISADLAEAARTAAAAAERSLTAQIEHWARMGKKMDEQLTGAAMMAYKSAASDNAAIREPAHQEEIEAVLAKLRQPGYATMVAKASRDLDVHEVLYGGDPEGSDLIVAHYRDGRKVKGRLVGRKFVLGAASKLVAKPAVISRAVSPQREKTTTRHAG